MMRPVHLPLEVFKAGPTGRRPWGKPRACWRDYILSGLGMPRGPPGGAEKRCPEEGLLEYLA